MNTVSTWDAHPASCRAFTRRGWTETLWLFADNADFSATERPIGAHRRRSAPIGVYQSIDLN
jgi:hypothetical protein